MSRSDVTETLFEMSRVLFGVTVRTLPEAADVTLAQFRALVLLDPDSGMRMTVLADHLGVSPSTATRLGDRLAGRGLVQRTPSETDRRAIILSLTNAGHAVVKEAMRRRRHVIAAAVRKLSDDEAVEVQRGLELAIEAFEDRDRPRLASGAARRSATV
jgi:DNA-binding MarR family transcriptional regulator